MNKNLELQIEQLLLTECRRSIETADFRPEEYVGKNTIFKMINEYKENKTVSPELIQRITGYEAKDILGIKIKFSDIKNGFLASNIKKINFFLKNNIYGFASDLKKKLNLPVNKLDNYMISIFKKNRQKMLEKNPIMKEVYNFIIRTVSIEQKGLSECLKYYDNNISNKTLIQHIFGDIYPRYFSPNILINFLNEKGMQIVNNCSLIECLTELLEQPVSTGQEVVEWLININKATTVSNGLRVEELLSFHRKNFDSYEYSDSSYHMYVVKHEDIQKALNNLSEYILKVFKNFDRLTDEEYIKEIAVIRYRFLRIHPFNDGNGRTSRLLANMLALKKGFTINFNDKDEDYKTIENAFVAIHNNYEKNDNSDNYLLDLANNPDNCKKMENEEAISHLTHYLKQHIINPYTSNINQAELKPATTSLTEKSELKALASHFYSVLIERKKEIEQEKEGLSSTIKRR